LIAAIKDWLPITDRNRVALGFAFAALVMFVWWIFCRIIIMGGALVMTNIWADIVNPDFYLHVFRTPDIDGFLAVAACMALC
jgi:hypothetical protein